jgi:hypothetical protein
MIQCRTDIIGFLWERLHGLINYTDIKAKCGRFKKFTCKGTLRQGREGKGVELSKETVRGATVHKAESKIPT